MLKPVNVQNLEAILTKIWDGTLQHNQSEFFCGTSCCLAGWDLVLNHDAISKLEPEERAELVCECALDFWDWSKNHNNLTSAEANLLFGTHSTKALHKAVLKSLKAGKRLELDYPDSLLISASNPSSPSYYVRGEACIQTDNIEDSELIWDFLEGEFPIETDLDYISNIFT